MSGTLHTWGRAFNGPLGNGTTTPDVLAPAQIGVDTAWAALMSSFRSMGAIKSDGTLWTWGEATSGALGNGTTTPNVLEPTQVGVATDWAKLGSSTSANYNMLAIKTDGTLWGWGVNGDSELGLGAAGQQVSPAQVGSDTDWLQVSNGNNHSAAVKVGGTLWTWGWQGNGALGDGTFTADSVVSPAQIGVATNWAAVACGTNFTFARKTDGTLWSCGLNNSGQLGHNNTTPLNTLTQVGSDTDWAAVSCGDAHALALKTDGTLWACGEAGAGAVGDGGTTDRHVFVQIGSDTDWVRVYAGLFTSSAVKSDGSVYAWGEAAFGGAGNGTSTPNVLAPELIYSGDTGTFVAMGNAFGALIDQAAVVVPPNAFWTDFAGTVELT